MFALRDLPNSEQQQLDIDYGGSSRPIRLLQ
jgi:hypothetical protein